MECLSEKERYEIRLKYNVLAALSGAAFALVEDEPEVV